MQDLTGKVTGSTLTTVEWNQLPSEVQNVIEGTGIVLSSGDLNQLGKSIANYSGAGSHYLESGAVNAYVLGVVGIKQAPTDYVEGLKISFNPGNTNTGPSTVNVSGIGVTNILTEGGGALNGGEIISGRFITLTYSNAVGAFLLPAESTRFFTKTDWTTVFSNNGYTILPTGLIIQWGTTPVVAPGTSVVQNFTIAFPTSVYVAIGTAVGIAVNNNAEGLGIGKTLTNLTAYNWGSAISFSNGVSWIAIGV